MAARRFKFIVSYQGTDFQGWQVQPNARTVQSEIESTLAVLEPDSSPRISGSGRTDSGVHARAQVFHADLERPFTPDKWRNALNGLLPEDVRIMSVQQVNEDFHARFSATGKQYRYFLHRGPCCPPYLREVRHTLRRPLDLDLFKKAADALTGTHDFRSFSAIRVDANENTVRNVRRLEVVDHDSEIEIIVEAEGFLYKMVRQLVGAMLRVGLSEMTLEDVKDLRDAPRISHDAPSAPAKGLFLWDVLY